MTTPFSQEEDRAKLTDLLATKKVVVCYGAGGVGKTTTSAALGVKAAVEGRRVLVLTIDPAKRLADTLNISIESADPHTVAPERFVELGVETKGSLSLWMVQPPIVFENAIMGITSKERVGELDGLSIYQSMKSLVSGMQEYMAGESLYQFATSEKFDLIILDTPPSRNAVDFLMAPEQLLGFLDSRILRAFAPGEPGRFSLLGRAKQGLQSIFKNIGGGGFFGQVQTFTSLVLDGLDVLKGHAAYVQRLLRSEGAAHIVVTSPEAASLEEATYFQGVLERIGLPLSGMLVNRSLAANEGETLSGYLEEHPEVRIGEDTSGLSEAELTQAVALLAPYEEGEKQTAEAHQALLGDLRRKISAKTLLLASPHLGRDIDDLDGLLRLARKL